MKRSNMLGIIVYIDNPVNLFGACGNTGFRYNTIETATFFR